jgi:hypothetical protein
MAVIQPLYFSGGRYSASVDRKLLAALIQSDSSGNRIEGVIPTSYDTGTNTFTNSLSVAHSSDRTFSISSGLCVIADSSTQDVDTPGVFLAGVDTSAETVTLSNNSSGAPRYDLVYADVTQDSFVITKKARSGSNVATITTSAPHGFVDGQTVYVSGVDESFDGAYVITDVPTTTTFTYANTGASVTEVDVKPTAQIGNTIVTISKKELVSNLATLTVSADLTSFDDNSLIKVRGVDGTFDGDYHVESTSAVGSVYEVTYKINRTPLANVTEVAVTNSSNARARVPFAIKVVESTNSNPSLPSGTNIKLAKIQVPNGSGSLASAVITDLRQFTTTVGGVHIYDGSNSEVPVLSLPEGSLRYDTSDKSLEYNNGVAWVPVSNLTLSGTGSATATAARSDHTHTEFNNYLGISQVLASDSATTVTPLLFFPLASDTTQLAANKTYLFEARIIFTGTGIVSLELQPSTNFTAASFRFITWSQVESSSINQSGYDTSVSGSFPITSSLSSNSVVCHVSGVVVTSSSATNVIPRLSSATGGANLTLRSGSWIRFNELGSNTVTVVNGTWS